MSTNQYEEHLAHSEPCASRWDGFDRGDLGTSHEDEMTDYAAAVAADQCSQLCIDMTGELTLPKLDGKEVSPGVWMIGEPTPVAGTDKLRGLAEVQGCLCTVELRLRFLTPNAYAIRKSPAE